MSSPSPAPAPAPAPAAAPSQLAQPGSSRFCTSHFITGEFRPSHTFPDDAAYALCLDTLVKACNDVALVHRGRVFLGKRQVFPQKDFCRFLLAAKRMCDRRDADATATLLVLNGAGSLILFCFFFFFFLLSFSALAVSGYGCGGRMKPGESVFDATRRLLHREVKLDLSVEDLKRRLLTVGSYSFLWGLCPRRSHTDTHAREGSPRSLGCGVGPAGAVMRVTESFLLGHSL